MAVFRLWGSAASLLFNKDLGFKKSAEIVHTFIGYPHFNRPISLVARRRIKIDAIAAGVQISTAVVALFRNTDFLHQLNFRSAIVAASNQVEFGLDPASSPFLTRRRFWLSFPVRIHIAGLSIFSGHFSLDGSSDFCERGGSRNPTRWIARLFAVTY